jgi:hypothetical protein
MTACTRTDTAEPEVMIIPPGSLLTSRSTGPETDRVRSKVPGSDASATHVVTKTNASDAMNTNLIFEAFRG